MYRIEAEFSPDGQAGVDCSTPETLGEAYAAQYRTFEHAVRIANELQGTVQESGLDPTTNYVVYREGSGFPVY